MGFYGFPEISFAITEGELVFTISPKIYGNEPEYRFLFNRYFDDESTITVLSNNKFFIQSIKLLNSSALIASNSSVNKEATSNNGWQHLGEYAYSASISLNHSDIDAGIYPVVKIQIKRESIETVWAIAITGSAIPPLTGWFEFNSVSSIFGE
ncbi:MAG: hypothetical protein RLN90_01185 [Balneolaceae bacterium]